MRNLTGASAAIVAALLPSSALAAQTIVQLSQSIQRTVYRPLTAVIIGFALLLFFWGITRYVAQAGDEGKAAEGAKMMSYGVLVLFVMFAVWGIVRMGLAFFGFDGGADASPGSSVFGVSARNYDSGLNYGAKDYDYSNTYDYKGFQP